MGNVVFENNEQLENDYGKKFWFLTLNSSNYCSVVLNNKIFGDARFYGNLNVQINNCKFYGDTDKYSCFEYLMTEGNATVIVNESEFNNCKINCNGESSLILNNCVSNLYGRKCGHRQFGGDGYLSINGGSYDFVFPKKSANNNYNIAFHALGSLDINGGTFNFENEDSAASLYVCCDATISNAKFNFTGDEYNSSYCAYFTNGTNGSTIKNCEFIIDKCAHGGFYAYQAGLKIENSKFDINLHYEELNSSNFGFYCGDEISFNNCEIICEDSYYGFYSVTGLNLIDCKTSLKKCKNMGIEFEGNLYINGGKLDIFESSNQGICSAWANGSSLLIENCNVSLSDQLQNGILFTYIENGLISINNSFIGTNTRIVFTSTGTTIIKDSILNCKYITSSTSTWPVIISNTSGVW